MREMRLGVALLVEELLPLPHHAEPAVVHDHDDDRQPLERRGRQFLPGHLEAAVAVDADDRRVGTRSLRADRCRDAVAHRPEPARRDERARPVADQVLHRPHLMLPDAGRPDHVVAVAGEVAQRLDDGLRLEHAVGTRVAVRETGTPILELAQPGRATIEGGRPALRARESAGFSGPTTGISASRIFPTSAASMSKWITFASGANAETLPVTRSSKREPTAITRSALFSAQFAYFDPCIPGGP